MTSAHIEMTILIDLFSAKLQKALHQLQEERELNGWPAAGARFELETATIRYLPPNLAYEFSAIVAIRSPETDDYIRHHLRTLSEIFLLEALTIEEDDMQVLVPYMEACGQVLAYRVGRVLSERYG